MSPTPSTPAEITPAWLTEVLPGDTLGGGRVTAAATTDIGAGTGIFGEIARIDLTVAGGTAPGTKSIVAKMACTEPANLEVALMLGIYDREINMFEQAVGESPMRAPACHYAERIDGGRFVLLMEDLSIEFDVGDQVIGATVSQAEAAIDVLADFHAYWWENPRLNEFDWLPRPDAPIYKAAVPGIYHAGLPILQAEWTDRVPPASIELATAIGAKFEELLDRTAGGPDTLIHTDTRLDNIFFAKDGSGDVAFIDFQLALRGRGAADIAYLIGTSVPQADASAHWRSLLQRWHDRLTTNGVVGYSFDDALLHYREAAMYYVSGAMSLIGSFDTGNERGAAMALAYSTRILNHIIDIGAGSVL